jgi:hypothetical protein
VAKAPHSRHFVERSTQRSGNREHDYGHHDTRPATSQGPMVKFGLLALLLRAMFSA